MATELQPEYNKLRSLFRDIKAENFFVTLLTILAGVCVVVTIGSYYESRDARKTADNALATVEAMREYDDRWEESYNNLQREIDRDSTRWEVAYEEVSEECRMAQLEVDAFRIAMSDAGIKVPHKEKP